MKEVYKTPPGAFRELTEVYEHKGKRVDMASARECSYSVVSEDDDDDEDEEGEEILPTIKLGSKIRPKKATNGSSHTPMDIKFRGITLRQLRAIKANIIARCEKEKWVEWEGKRLTPEKVTLYDIDKYIVKPFTKDSKVSFVETLPSTCGTQPPRFFMSHWWGNPFFDTLECLEQFEQDFSINQCDSDEAKGKGMTLNTPIWICAFANNQWELENAIPDDPNQSSFNFALSGPAENRVITILDKKGFVFTRIWCNFELYLVFTAQMKKSHANVDKGLWAVYTAHKHTDKSGEEIYAAVGMVSGGVPNDSAAMNSERESHFPADLILKSLNIKVESSKASRDDDRRHILNCIVENKNLDAKPAEKHSNYKKVNDAVRGAFAASMPALKAAHAAGGKAWKDTLDCLSKGVVTGTFNLYFELFSPLLTSSQARELVSNGPLTCAGVSISFAKGKDGKGAVEGLIDWLAQAKPVKEITLFRVNVGNAEYGRNAGARLAAALKASRHAKSITKLRIRGTNLVASENLTEWVSALKDMKSLKDVMFSENCELSKKELSILKDATHATGWVCIKN